MRVRTAAMAAATLLLLLLLLVAGAAVLVVHMDPAMYRDFLVRQVREATGRELRLGPDTHIALVPAPSIEAEQVTLSNAPWASQPHMVSAERLRAEVALLPLLRGQVEIRRLVLVSPELHLARNAAGRGNWALGEPAPAAPSGAGPIGAPRLFVSDLHVEDATITYSDARTGETVTAGVEKLSFEVRRGTVEMELRGRYQDLPVTLEGDAGQHGALFYNRPLELDLLATVGDAHARLTGEIHRPHDLSGLRLTVNADVPATAPFARLAGADLPELGPVTGRTTVVEDQGEYRLEAVELTAEPAGGRLVVKGKVARLARGLAPELELSLELETETLSALAEIAGTELPDLGPVRGTATLTGASGAYRLDDLDLTARPERAELAVKGSIADLTGALRPELAVHVDAETTKQLTAIAGADLPELGPLTGRATLTGEKEAYRLENVDLTSRTGGARIGAEGSVADLTGALRPTLEVSVDAESTSGLTAMLGADLPELGPLTGRATLTGEKGAYRLENLDLTSEAAGAEIGLQGTIADLPRAPRPELDVSVEAESTTALAELAGLDLPELGPFTARTRLVSEKGRYRLENLDLASRAGGAEITVTGGVADLAASPEPQLDIRVAADSLAQLSALGGTELPAIGPLRVSARLETAELGYRASAIDARLGESDLAGTLTVSLARERPVIVAELSAERLDLDELFPESEDGRGNAETAPADGRLFSADPFPVASLRAMDAKARLQVRTLHGRIFEASDFDATLTLEDGRLEFVPKARLAGGSVEARLAVDARDDPPAIALRMQGTGLDVGQVRQSLHGTRLVEGATADLAVDVEGRGASPRELAAGLDGDAALVTSGGRINNPVLDRVGADLTMQIIRAAVPFGEEQAVTEMRCSVARFRIARGIASADETIALETTKVKLVGSGLVDLGREELDLGIVLEPVRGVGVSAASLTNVLRVRGTLTKPEVLPTVKGVATTAATVTGAFATGGLSLLAQGLFEHVTRDPHPCETARTRELAPAAERVTQEVGPAAGPDAPEDRADRGVNPTGIIKGIGKTLKDLLPSGSDVSPTTEPQPPPASR